MDTIFYCFGKKKCSSSQRFHSANSSIFRTPPQGTSPRQKKEENEFYFYSPVALPPKLKQREILQKYKNDVALPMKKKGYNSSDRFANLLHGDNRKIGGRRRKTKKLKSKPTGNKSTVVS